MPGLNGNAVERRRTILLMGSPRSGTSWLAKVLDTHPGVFYLHEPLAKLRLPALKPAITRLLTTGALEPEEAADLLRGLDRAHHVCCRPPFFPKTFLRTPSWALAAAWTTVGWAQRGRTAFTHCFSPNSAAPYDILIKEVDWQSHAQNIVQGLNPDYLIFIVRHPGAVVSSRLNGLKMGVIHGHDRSRWLERSGPQCEELGFSIQQVRDMPLWEFYALDWVLQNLSYRRIAQSRRQTMTVVYQDLCLDPDKTAAALFSFLGWGATPQTARFIRATTHSPLRTRLMRLWGGKRLYYDLYRDPSDALSAWRQQLTAEQQAGILRICSHFPDMAHWSDEEAAAESGAMAGGRIVLQARTAVGATKGFHANGETRGSSGRVATLEPVGRSVALMPVLDDPAREQQPTPSPSPPATAVPESDDLPETVIERRPGWQVVNLREMWRYRELLFFLTWRDVKVRYKQTVLGAAWAVLQPLATMLVFAFFLGRMGGISQGVANYPLFVFAGVLPWTFFANAVSAAGNSVVANERLVSKIYFPRLIIPIGSVGASLFDFGIALAMLAGMMIWFAAMPGWQIVLAPLIMLLLTATAVGVGTLLAALIVAHRDFRYVLTFAVQLWLFATPCIYLPPSAVGPTARLLLPLNPAYGLLLNFRQAVLGGDLDGYALAVSSAVGLVLLMIGCFYFRRVERSFADVI